MCDPEFLPNRLRGGPGREESISLPDGAVMPAFLALPETRSGPGVLVIPSRYGRTRFFEDVARRIAGLGYVALCAEPFHRAKPLPDPGVERVRVRYASADEPQMLVDLDAALDWLHARPEVTSTRLGVVGFCMGGSFALNLAAMRDDLAVCCFHGFPAGPKGAAVPAPAPLDVVGEIEGPLIGFWGESDADVDLGEVRRLADALSARGVGFHCVTYPRVQHGFMAEEPRDDRTRDAARHAWARMSAFLCRNLAEVEPEDPPLDSIPAA